MVYLQALCKLRTANSLNQSLSIAFHFFASRYLIYNLSDPLDANNKWGPSDFLLPYCMKHKNCILFENTYYSVNVGINRPVDATSENVWRGHHGAPGNQLFFEKSIKPKLEELFC